LAPLYAEEDRDICNDAAWAALHMRALTIIRPVYWRQGTLLDLLDTLLGNLTKTDRFPEGAVLTPFQAHLAPL